MFHFYLFINKKKLNHAVKMAQYIQEETQQTHCLNA